MADTNKSRARAKAAKLAAQENSVVVSEAVKPANVQAKGANKPMTTKPISTYETVKKTAEELVAAMVEEMTPIMAPVFNKLVVAAAKGAIKHVTGGAMEIEAPKSAEPEAEKAEVTLPELGVPEVPKKTRTRSKPAVAPAVVPVPEPVVEAPVTPPPAPAKGKFGRVAAPAAPVLFISTIKVGDIFEVTETDEDGKLDVMKVRVDSIDTKAGSFMGTAAGVKVSDKPVAYEPSLKGSFEIGKAAKYQAEFVVPIDGKGYKALPK